MKQKTSIELIPWVHSIELAIHKELIDYVKKMPKNSTIALEISPKIYEFLIEHPTAYPTDKQGMAFAELLHEIRKLNITIIPIETSTSTKAGEKTQKTAKFYENRKGEITNKTITKWLKTWAKTSIFREQNFARQIQTIIKKFNQPKLFVVTGLAHTISIQTQLKKMGITTSIQTQKFRQKTEIEKIAKLYYDFINAYKKKQEKKMQNIALQIFKLHEFPQRNLELKSWKQFLQIKLLTRKEKQKQRTKKRLKIRRK